jgi:hypothetical protein
VKGWRLFAALSLAAGLPIVLVVWAYLKEISDLGAWARMNPLGGVAARLMDQVETQIDRGRAQIRAVADDPEVADPASAAPALARYEPYLASGRFKALILKLDDGRRLSRPEAVPLPPGALADDPPAPGISELIATPDGGWVLAVTEPLAGGGRGAWVTGLFDVSAVLGQSMVDRMRVARWGEAFIADREGRIFLSANPGLLGRSLGDLGLDRARATNGLYTADGWRDNREHPHFVALAESHGYYPGPQNGWRVGLLVPEEVVGARSRGLSAWIGVIIAAVVAITVGLGLVLRHSMRGAPR